MMYAIPLYECTTVYLCTLFLSAYEWIWNEHAYTDLFVDMGFHFGEEITVELLDPKIGVHLIL